MLKVEDRFMIKDLHCRGLTISDIARITGQDCENKQGRGLDIIRRGGWENIQDRGLDIIQGGGL
jgi:hypothetical protein